MADDLRIDVHVEVDEREIVAGIEAALAPLQARLLADINATIARLAAVNAGGGQ